MRRRVLQKESTLTPGGKNVIACGDLHIREATPSMRIEEDFFHEVIEPKIEWVVEQSNKYQAPICIAGDIYDHAHPRYYLSNRVTQLFRKAQYGIYAVPGQHDMNFHSQLLMDTPYQSLIEAGVIQDVHGYVGNNPEDYFLVTGAGFGIEPKFQADILLVHSCITENNPPFFLPDALSANEYLDKYPNYDIIISGDYHVSHVTEKDGRLLVNCGPLFRKDKTQIDTRPKIYVINVDDKSYEALYVPIQAGEDAFDLDKINRAKKIGVSELDTSKLQQLITDNSGTKTTIDFPSVVSLVCTQFETDRGVVIPKDKLMSIMQRSANG